MELSAEINSKIELNCCKMNKVYLNAFGAQIIPDPTIAGNYLRRFDQKNVVLLIDIVANSKKAHSQY